MTTKLFNTSEQLEGGWFPDVEGPRLLSLERNLELTLLSAAQEHCIDFQESIYCQAMVLPSLLVISSLQSSAVLPVRFG